METGSTIGHYEVLDLIGKGGMGRVFRGKDTRTGATVAIKVLPKEAIEEGSELLPRLIRESEALRLLNHPNIVKMLDFVQQDQESAIVLEYVGGGSLYDLLAKEPRQPIDKVLKVAIGVADALTRAHHLKIIHRDIKPANILLVEDGTPRLTDFGLARMQEAAQNLTQSGVLVGSYAYLCPEILQHATPDPRMDIWAFGVVLYEMLAGRRPFDGESTAAILTGILTEPVPDLMQFRNDVPPALVALILAMLEKSPEQRIPSIRRVGAELETIARDPNSPSTISRPSIALPQFATPTPSKPMRDDATVLTNTVPSVTIPHQGQPSRWRNRGITAGVVALVCIVIGAVFIAPALRDSPEKAAQASVVPVEPVAPDEMMVLVAKLEPVRATSRSEVERFISEDLRQTIEVSAPMTNIRIREYPNIIRTAEEAEQVATADQAALIIWGSYSDDFIELKIQPHATTQMALPPEMLGETASVTLHMTDERSQSIAPQVLISAAIWQAFKGDAYYAAAAMVAYEELDLEGAEVVGVSVGMHVQRHYETLYSDTDAAVASLDAALRIDPRNPFLYHLRGAALHRLGRLSEALQDVNTALLLSDKQWVIPYVNMSNIEVSEGKIDEGIDALGEGILLAPEDWLLYTMRGSFYYLNKDYENAKTDLDQSIALHPKANFPYVLSMNIAIREGRVDDVSALLDTVLREFPDPTFGTRIILTAGNQPEYGGFYASLLSAFSNMALRQYDAAIRDIQAALELQSDLPEVYLFEGVAYCSIGDYESAEAAYTKGIELDPDLTVLYLLRSDVRNRLKNIAGALEDFGAAQKTSTWENFAPLVEDALGSGGSALGCENFFSS